MALVGLTWVLLQFVCVVLFNAWVQIRCLGSWGTRRVISLYSSAMFLSGVVFLGPVSVLCRLGCRIDFLMGSLRGFFHWL